jgi:hypothetical protein
MVTTPNTLAVDKTPFIKVLEQTPTWQYIFLRPQRWGKSAILSMLAEYYDVNKSERLADTFGHLSIGKESNPPDRNSLLVLILDFSTVSSITERDFRESFDQALEQGFGDFAATNKAVLGDGAPDRIYGKDGRPSLLAVLVSVKQARHLPMLLTGLFRT